MNFLRNWASKNCINNNENQLQKWAAISAFLVLAGDLIAFILAIMEIQNNSCNFNSCPVKTQVKSLEEKIAAKNLTNQEIIRVLEEKINELKTAL